MEIKNIHQRILGVMNDLDYIQKGTGKVNNQYTFVSHDAVASSVHPLFVKHGITAIPSVEEMTQEHNRTKCVLTVIFVNVDQPSDYIGVKFVGYGIDSGDKGPGKAISYAYKYALLKVLCLETGDDPDNDANARYEPPKCLEFDSALPDMDDKRRAKLDKFLESISKSSNKHIEDIKQEAVARMSDFIRAFDSWKG